MKKAVSFVLMILVFTSGCATMYNSGAQTLLAKSADDKEGVQIEITTPAGSYRSKLPATIVAEPAHAGVQIRVVDPCYDNTVMEVNKSVTPSFWANIFWFYGVLIGMGVDTITGKMWKYDSMVLVHTAGKCQEKQ